MNWLHCNSVLDALECMERFPDTESVAGFLPGDGIYRLELKFDIDQLRQALDHCLARTGYVDSDWKHQGFGVLPLTQKSGGDAVTPKTRATTMREAGELSRSHPRARPAHQSRMAHVSPSLDADVLQAQQASFDILYSILH